MIAEPPVSCPVCEGRGGWHRGDGHPEAKPVYGDTNWMLCVYCHGHKVVPPIPFPYPYPEGRS